MPDVLGGDRRRPGPMPASPLAGTQMGMFWCRTIGSGVWVEFEQGDPDYPIWTGGWCGSTAEVPALAQAAAPGPPDRPADRQNS